MCDTSSSVLIDSHPPLAPEILGSIIDHLRGDNATLKECSLVSRSFHSPSRRNLFFFVDLDTTEKVDRLHHLLATSPEIGLYIRKLAVTLDGAKEWFASNTILADIFNMMPGLMALFSGKWRRRLWQELSSELRTALVKLFRSSLTTVTIKALDNFPLSILHAVSPLKKLELSYINLLENDSKLVILPHLETLVLLHRAGEPVGIELITPNLRQLSFMDFTDEHPSILAQQAVDTAAGSLERIQWDYNLHKADHNIKLKGLHCLQFLTFKVKHVGVKEWERNFRIIDILKDTSVTQSLKELTIGVITYLDNFTDTGWRGVYDSKIWKDLDFVLSSIPALQRVFITFDIARCNIPPQFWAGMRASMPLLEKCGILTIAEGYVHQLEHEIWSLGP